MTQLTYCIGKLNAVVSDRTFSGLRIPTVAEVAGVVQIKSAIVLLQHADANFALSDAFFGEPSSSQHVTSLGEDCKQAGGDGSPKRGEVA